LADALSCRLAIFPSQGFNPHPFQILIYSEEVGHFGQEVLGDIDDLQVVSVEGVRGGDSEDLVVRFLTIQHLEESDGAGLDDAARKTGLSDHDQDIERVAIFSEGLGYEAIVAGVMDGRVENPVELNAAHLCVIFIFVPGTFRHLDDDIYHPRWIGAGGKVSPKIHLLPPLICYIVMGFFQLFN